MKTDAELLAEEVALLLRSKAAIARLAEITYSDLAADLGEDIPAFLVDYEARVTGNPSPESPAPAAQRAGDDQLDFHRCDKHRRSGSGLCPDCAPKPPCPTCGGRREVEGGIGDAGIEWWPCPTCFQEVKP